MNSKLKQLVARECELLEEILACIREIDAEKLYLGWGFSNLFDYLTKEIGYSNAAAQRRIDAARLSEEIPEVLDHVRDGTLNLSQIGEAQKGFRRAEVSTEEKKEILEKLAAAPTARAEKIVAEELELPPVNKPSARTQGDGSVRLAMTFSAEAAENLAKVRNQLSHSIPNGDPGEIFAKLLAFYLEKQPKSTSAAEVTPRQKTIPRAVRRAVFARDKCCQFKSPTGQICGSTYQLQVDHIQMRFHGGGHELENLRLLCGAHNRYAAEQTMQGKPAP